jgi:hypothetical protein
MNASRNGPRSAGAMNGAAKRLGVAMLGAMLSLPAWAAQPTNDPPTNTAATRVPPTSTAPMSTAPMSTAPMSASPTRATPASARTPSAKLLLPDFSSLGSAATDSVSITLDAPLLAFAARFLDTGDPDERAAKELIGGLQGIYVRSYTFDKSFAYPASDIAALRKQLGAPCWQQIVQTRSSKQQSAVDIFVCQAQQKPLGLAVIATEPRQLTIVNIVGAIDLEKLHRIEGRLGVPKLPAEQ